MIPHGPLDEPKTSHLSGSEPGVELAVHDFGGGTQPLLFVHGTGLVSRMWEPVIERLALEDIRPICVDLRLHGTSRHPDGTTYFDHQVVADLATVAGALELDGAWAVGHSMGGATIMQTELLRPSTFSRLWVYEPIIFQQTPDHNERITEFAAAVSKRRSIYPSREDAAARYSSRPPLDELSSEAMDAYLRYGFTDLPDGTVELACDPDDEARAFIEFLADGWDSLPNMSVPTLVAHGQATTEGAPQWSPAIAERLQHGQAQLFDGSFHFGPFGELDRAAASISSWFGAAVDG